MFEAQKFEIDPTLFSTKAVGVLCGIFFMKQVESTSDRQMEFFHFFFIT